MIRVDFHVHTTFSIDSQITPKILVEQLLAHPSVKAVAVTDHGTVQGIDVVRRLADAYSDVLIIPGVEITTFEGDILVLGAEALPPKPWSVENVVAFARKNGYVSVAAHPFREFGLGEVAKTSNLDAVEIVNGGSSSSANRQARDLAKSLGLPGIAGSDAHSPAGLFSICTEVRASLDVGEILTAVKKGLVGVPSVGDSICF